jgi:hypothetical protein
VFVPSVRMAIVSMVSGVSVSTVSVTRVTVTGVGMRASVITGCVMSAVAAEAA